MKPSWLALAATCRGSLHGPSGINQDACATCVEGEIAAVAVADGHGHRAHFRSEIGSRFAADLTVDLAMEAARAASDASHLRSLLDEQLAPSLVSGWQQRVREHVRLHPFSADDRVALTGSGEEAVLRPYGSTVIALVATSSCLGVVQLGDGDAVVAFAAGEASRPLPEDPQLDGIHTTSLCQLDAQQYVRATALDVRASEVALAFAATDGFGAPQVDGTGWWRQVGAELVTHLRIHGAAWMAAKLPEWLIEPAETGGDDTTFALLLNQTLAE